MQDGNYSNSLEATMKNPSKEDPAFFTVAPQVTVISSELQSESNNEQSVKVPFRKKVENILDSIPLSVAMTVVTIYALFGDDIKSTAFPKTADVVFSSLVVTCLALFTIELVLSYIYKDGYKWSFYFWLDVVATISLIADISWIYDAAIGLNSSDTSNLKNASNLQNAGKASKAGTKATRALRIIRIVRLIRIVKLYKNAQAVLKKKPKDGEDAELLKGMQVTSESNVGKKMSDATMKRVIIIVLVMLFLLPFFETDFYFTYQTSWDFGLVEMNKFVNTDSFESVKNEYVSFHQNDIRPLVYLSYANETGSYYWFGQTNYTDLRYYEIYYSSYKSFVVIFDLRYDSRFGSLLNMMETIYICIALTLGAIYFSKDSEDLVIKPIEKMIEKVKLIAKNPIAAAEIQAISAQLDKEDQKKTVSCFCFTSEPKENMETKVLENTILKIGVLLALGFGEAGSIIIGSNVEQGGEIDPMASGAKVVGIYGFCDIRNFTDTTEELQEGVMMFVNEIAQVVHGVVDKYLGAANKNIGDAFLLVWKFNSDEFYLDNEDQIVRNPASLRASYLPDLTLLSFLKILAKCNKDPVILKYRNNQKLLQRMPNYEVKMGFGLHLGWAIEGAIGSQFKIDASYLSPNVNVASALEGSTKIYGVPLLISSTLFDVFSEGVQKFCRHIDTVYIKGNSRPLGLYTSDCDFSDFRPGKAADRSKNYFRKKRKALKKSLESGDVTTSEIYLKSNEITLMRRGFGEEFFEKFDKGVKQYLAGDWGAAKVQMEQALAIRTRDGPSLAIMNFISDFGFKAPANWKHARYLG
jgi:class 3 adenylate cyclase